MGLLDYLPGDQDDRMAFYQGLASGDMSGSLMAGRERKLKRGLLDAQIEETKAQAAQRKAAAEKQGDGMAMLRGLLSAGPSYEPGQLGSGSFDAVQNPNAFSPRPAGPGGMARATPEQIALAKVYGHDLMEPWKIAKEGFEQKPGTYRVNATTGAREYVMDPRDGRTVDASGRIGLAPGAMDALTATTMAQEGPKALLGSAGKMNLRKNADGTDSAVSELTENTALQRLLGGYLQGGTLGAPTAAPQDMPQPAPVPPRPMQPQASPMPPQPARPMPQRGALIRPGDADRQAIFTQEMTAAQARLAAARTPEERQRAQNDVAGLGREMTNAGIGYGKTTTQETKEKLSADAGGKINDSWLRNSYEPTVALLTTSRDLIDTVQVTRQAMTNLGGTGWSTQAKAAGAAVLTGLGVGSKNAEMFASNAQVFQSKVVERINAELNIAKGPQTDQDAQRATKTWASLANTPQANSFIMDFAEAKAMRDQMKAKFYQSALPHAKANGDLSEVDREWAKRTPSIFSMPPMKSWGGGGK